MTWQMALSSVRRTSCMLLVTAMILFGTRLIPRGEREVGMRTTVVMGVAQAIAIIPGISRSGSTIAAGMATVHVTPWMAAIAGGLGVLSHEVAVAGLTTLGVMFSIRLILYRVFGYPVLAALFLHPVEVALFFYVFARSTVQVGILGTVRWRGRPYPARVTSCGEMPDKP